MVKVFVLEAVEPVYCNVPVVPLPPSVTGVALLPNTPLLLALLIVAMLKVPLWMVSAPVNVFTPLSVSMPLPV
jgi:hypothetical protein